MKKKKRKKKNRNVKKMEIQKTQAENQQEVLSADVDKTQVENRQEILGDAAEKEQRRTTRLGAIIAIVAVIGTVCAFLFKMTISSLNVWSEQGIMYWYFQALFSFALSISVIIFADIVMYVISDLKRYNTLDHNYKKYDKESDSRYVYLLNDFNIYTIMLFFVFILSFPLSTIYGEKDQKWSGILLSCLCGLVGIVFVVRWAKAKDKKEIKRILLKVGEKIAKWMFVAFFCFTISVVFIVNNKATISVSYNADGIVEICNTSAESYNGLDIEIWNKDGEIIYTESVEKEKLLFAREDKYFNNEVAGEKVVEGILINSECLHWKYMFDLKEVINEADKYCVSITVYQNGKSVYLINSLSVDEENNEYTFAKDSMYKVY